MIAKVADYALNRQYSQSVGRFVRVDPVKGRVGNPQAGNGYSYVHNDPINLVDGLGREQRVDGQHEAYLDIASETAREDSDDMDSGDSIGIFQMKKIHHRE